MLAQEIRIRGEPTADPQKCRFVLEAEVLSRSPVSFDRESDTSKAPLAERLLALPYIAGASHGYRRCRLIHSSKIID